MAELLSESGLSVGDVGRLAQEPELAARPDDPMPRELLDEVETDARERFEAASFDAEEGVRFTLPRWLAWCPAKVDPNRRRDLQVEIRHGRVSVRNVIAGHPRDREALENVWLRRTAASARRRGAMRARRKLLLATLAAVASRPLRLSDWLYDSLDDSAAAERRALVVLRRLLELSVPESFRICADRALSLADLLLLQDAGRPVLAFAEAQLG